MPISQPATLHPALLLIDADEKRAQCAARLLTLADFRPYVATTPFDAFRRYLQERFVPCAILVGHIDTQGHHVLSRLFQQLMHEQRKDLPVISLPSSVPDEIPLPAEGPSSSILNAHIQLLDTLWSALPATRVITKKRSFVLERLPSYGLMPRISAQRRSRNGHFRQILKAAHDLISADQWAILMTDVGLGEYTRMTDWPVDNDAHSIPAEYISCLHQAVACSHPDDPAARVRQWSIEATKASLQKRAPSVLTQQMLHLLPDDRIMSAVLNSFTNEMNEIRGEKLHAWIANPDGGYWLVHYSNLYVYGRVYRPQPVCDVWTSSVGETLHMLNMDSKWEIVEVECSCQTQTGHCLFALHPKVSRR